MWRNQSLKDFWMLKKIWNNSRHNWIFTSDRKRVTLYIDRNLWMWHIRRQLDHNNDVFYVDESVSGFLFPEELLSLKLLFYNFHLFAIVTGETFPSIDTHFFFFNCIEIWEWSIPFRRSLNCSFNINVAHNRM